MTGRRKRPAVTALAVLAVPLVVLAGFARLARQPGALLVEGERATVDEFVKPDEASPGNDRTRLYLPLHLRIGRERARTGHVPSWDPSGFGGRPLVGNPQAGLWYPPVWLLWWSRNPATSGWLTVAHLVVGGWGVLALGALLRLHVFAAIVAAGTFALSPYVLAQVAEGHDPHVWSVCWFPWIIAAIVRARRGAPGAVLAVPPLLALAVLAGHAQETYYLLLALLVWMARDLALAVRVGASRRARVTLLLIAGALALTVGLTAVEWLPAARHVAWLRRGVGASFGARDKYAVHWLNFLQLISPRALGGALDFAGFGNRWETLLATGWVALVLAVVGLVGGRRRRVVQGWAALAAGALAIALGRPLGVFALLAPIVPGMDLFRVPSRTLFLLALAAAMLAGIGLDRLARLEPRDWEALERLYRRTVLGLVAVLMMLAAGGWWLGLPGAVERSYDALGRVRGPAMGIRALIGCGALMREPLVGLALLGVGGLLAWGRLRPAARPRAAAGVGVLALAELVAYGVRDLPVTPAARFLGPDPIASELERQAPVRPYRVRARDAFYGDLPAALGGIEKTNVNDLFQLRHAAGLYEPLYWLFGPGPHSMGNGSRGPRQPSADHQRAVLARLNVAFVVSDRPVPELGWPVVASGAWDGATYRIYRDPAPLPRSYVVPRAAPLVERFETVPPREAVLMAADPLAGVSGVRQPFTPARYVASDPDHVVVQVATAAPGLLVVADTWMPGWTARLDGKPVPILCGNRAQRVVVLDRPGPHRIEMIYRPPGLTTGLTISALSAVLWLRLLLASRHRSTAAGPSPASASRIVESLLLNVPARGRRAGARGTSPATGGAGPSRAAC